MNKFMQTEPGFPDLLLILLLAICIVTDIKSRRIYNKILIPFLITALAANFLAGGWQNLLESLKGIILGLAMLIIPFARGGMGAGDVKLLAVIGGIKGPAFVVNTFLAAALAGGLIALFLLAVNGRLLSTLSRALGLLSQILLRYGVTIGAPNANREERQLYFPYTLAIGAGTAAAYSFSLQAMLR
ncbi:MAG: A24 family peptidase [Bacillota bacterium]